MADVNARPMMGKKPALPWYAIPGTLVALLTAGGGLGTCAVTYAKHRELPEKMAKVEQHNDVQDSSLDKLTAIEQQNQEMLKALIQSAPEAQAIKPWVMKGRGDALWCCYEQALEDCHKTDWEACDPK